jgi:preprotein translocase subunit SecE
MARKAKESAAKESAKKPNWFVRRWNGIKSWAHDMKVELKKVHWPEKSELLKACISVLVCVLVVGVFVWILDALAAAIINALLHIFRS